MTGSAYLGAAGHCLIVASLAMALLGIACEPTAREQPEQAHKMVVHSPVRLVESRSFHGSSIQLDPLPADVPSHLSSLEAVRAAGREGYGRNEGASEVTPLLAIYTGGGRSVPEGIPRHQDLLVWVLRYEGVCVPLFGPHFDDQFDDQRCAGSEINVVVNARTGRVLEGFSYR